MDVLVKWGLYKNFLLKWITLCHTFIKHTENVYCLLFPSSFSAFIVEGLSTTSSIIKKIGSLPIFTMQSPGFIEIELWNACIFHLRGFGARVTMWCMDQTHFHHCRQMKCKHNQISLVHNNNSPLKCQSPFPSSYVWWEIKVWVNLLSYANTLSALICSEEICLH